MLPKRAALRDPLSLSGGSAYRILCSNHDCFFQTLKYMGANASGSSLASRAAVNESVSRNHMSRRTFVRACGGVAAGFLWLPVPTGKLTIGVVRPALNGSFLNGVRMGVDEASRTAALFHKEVAMREVTTRAISGADVVTACVNDSQLRELAALCEQRGVMLLNCGSRSNALRRDLCRRTTYHVQASEAMYDDAAKLSHASRIALWDSKLERYGAAQLNDRYRAYAKEPMNDLAWAGWFAVKVAWESFARGPRDLTSMEFDGHKGAQLSFRAWDHQLRQPLYAVGERVVDVPDIARSPLPSRQLLDTIGDRAGGQSCAH